MTKPSHHQPGYLENKSPQRDGSSLAHTANTDFFESISDGFIRIDADWRITYINAKGETVLRRKREDILGKRFFDVFPESKGTPFEASYAKAMQSRQADTIEGYYGPQEGWAQVNIYPVCDGGLTFFYRDITSRKRMEILIESQREAMESALSGNSLESTLEVLVKAFEIQSGDGAIASILLMDDDERHLIHGSAPGLPSDYCNAIDGMEIGENGGCCGTSAYTKKLVVVEDIASDPRWINFKALALKHSLRACWSLPIFSQNKKVLGAFAVYYSQPHSPYTTDQEVMETLSRTAAIVIERDKERRRFLVHQEALRRGEERLRQQQRVYETVLSNTPDFVYIFDLEGRFTYANDALLKMWGRTSKDALGKNCLELGYEPWHAAMHDREIREVIHTRRPIRGEVPFTGAHGKRIYDYIFTPVIGDAGKVEAIAGTTRDVTDRKISEEALKESEAKWRTLTEAMPQLVWIDQADGYCSYLSRQWEEYTGKPTEQLLGFGWLDFLHPDDRLRTEEAWADVIAGRADYNMEYRLRRHDGEYCWFKTRGVPLSDETGKITMWYGTCTDIQEQVDARRMAEAANHAKTEFLANMSHEIRTPMNAVVGLINLLEMSDNKPARQKEFIQTLKTSAQQLMDLINDLLDVAKLEANQIQLERTHFTLDEIMAEVISINAVRANEKHIGLRIERKCETDIQLLGDPLRLRQVLMNIIGNSVKFTDSGEVIVCLYAEQHPQERIAQIQIDVKDTGIGIPHKKLETIFSKFSQADTSITRKYGGTGLGLSITKSLVDLMGGQISVVSEVGKGSTFTIRLPFGISKDSKQLNVYDRSSWLNIASDTKQQNTHYRILLVEDFHANILVATSMLSAFGYQVTVAQNGLEALEQIKKHPFDLILMDVQMPLMDGYKASGAIRERERQEHLPRSPIIGMTAHALQGDRERCIRAGMDDYIAKPFDPLLLSGKLAQYLSEKRDLTQRLDNHLQSVAELF